MIVMLVAAACGAGSGSAPPASQPAPAVATTYAEYATAFCSAFDALFQAVGNPDTGSGSILSKSLDAAVEAGDVAAAERAAAAMTTALEAGRQQATIAGGWQSAGPMMSQFDRVSVAFEAMVAAKKAAASHTPGASDPQAAFERAGGVEAWTAMLKAYPAVERPSGATQQACATAPIAP
jgi:hypothetical protein